eukprot:5647065-Amphidinium_carterae.1
MPYILISTYVHQKSSNSALPNALSEKETTYRDPICCERHISERSPSTQQLQAPMQNGNKYEYMKKREYNKHQNN